MRTTLPKVKIQSVAWRLLDLKHDVITLTNSPHRGNPFGESVKAFPYNFAKPHELKNSLCGVDVLINTYWVRFDKPPYFSFAQAVANAKALFDAAKGAGVRRLIHLSITNPDSSSDLPYFRGKAEIEEHIKETGLSHAILRPAVLFGKEDILINNITWALRTLPVFGIYGDGLYGCSRSILTTLPPRQLPVLRGKRTRQSMPSARKRSAIADWWK